MEDVPEVNVELIRDWLGPAFRAWARVMYGRRGFWFASGCLLWFVVLPYIAVKAAIFWGVVAAMCVAFLVTGTIDLITYRARFKREATRVWAAYLLKQ